VKLAITVAFSICCLASPAFSRAAPHLGGIFCEGRVEATPANQSGWYQIDVCSFDGHSSSGKTILDVCGVDIPCRVRANGEWERGVLYIKQVIFARRINGDALNEIPAQYRGVWVLQHDDKTAANGEVESRMPIGSKGIGWSRRPCPVTAIKNYPTGAVVVKLSCGGNKVTELWSLRTLNAIETLIVVEIPETESPIMPDVRVYVRDANVKSE
jgi:hypothetical protein